MKNLNIGQTVRVSAVVKPVYSEDHKERWLASFDKEPFLATVCGKARRSGGALMPIKENGSRDRRTLADRYTGIFWVVRVGWLNAEVLVDDEDIEATIDHFDMPERAANVIMDRKRVEMVEVTHSRDAKGELHVTHRDYLADEDGNEINTEKANDRRVVDSSARSAAYRY